MKLLNKLNYSLERPPPIKINYRCKIEILKKIQNYIGIRGGNIEYGGHNFYITDMYISDLPYDDSYYILTICYYGCLDCKYDCSKFDNLLDNINDGKIM